MPILLFEYEIEQTRDGKKEIVFLFTDNWYGTRSWILNIIRIISIDDAIVYLIPFKMDKTWREPT